MIVYRSRHRAKFKTCSYRTVTTPPHTLSQIKRFGPSFACLLLETEGMDHSDSNEDDERSLQILAGGETSKEIIPREIWSAEEDAILLGLSADVKGKKMRYKEIILPNRTPKACYSRLTKLLRKEAIEMHLSVWSDEDAQLLIDILGNHFSQRGARVPWEAIQSRFFLGLSTTELKEKWKSDLQPGVLSGVYAPQPSSPDIDDFIAAVNSTFFAGMTKIPQYSRMWTVEEDQKLAEGVEAHGAKNWKRIAAEFVPSKDHLQCWHRWKERVDPSLSKEKWTEAERQQLRDLVIAQYLAADPNLDIAAIIARKACWPDIELSFTTVARALGNRSKPSCTNEWHNNSDPSLRNDPWTEEERIRLNEIKAYEGGSFSDCWRLLHRSASQCCNQWRRAFGSNYIAGPLTNQEQVTLLHAIHNQQMNPIDIRTIRDELFPNRIAIDLKGFWDEHMWRLKKLIVKNPAEERHMDESTFLQIYHALPWDGKDFEVLVSDLQGLMNEKKKKIKKKVERTAEEREAINEKKKQWRMEKKAAASASDPLAVPAKRGRKRKTPAADEDEDAIEFGDAIQLPVKKKRGRKVKTEHILQASSDSEQDEEDMMIDE